MCDGGLRVVVIVGIWKHIVRVGHKNRNRTEARCKKEDKSKAILMSLAGVPARWSHTAESIVFTLFSLHTRRPCCHAILNEV